MYMWYFVFFSVVIIFLTLLSGYYYYQFQNSKKNLKLTLEATSDIIFLFDAQLKYVEVYASNENILIHSREELIGKDLEETLGPELGKRFTTVLREVFSTGNRQTVNYELTFDTGVSYFEATIEKRDSRIIVATVKDITSKKILEKQLEIQKAKQFESARLASLGEVAGGIAHEINTPLAVISLSSEQIQYLLKQNPLPSENLNDLALRIEQTANRIATIVKGLRTLTREASKDTKEFVPVETIVSNALNLVSEKIHHAEVELKVDLEKDLQILCRSVQISQVVLNLVNNSFYAVKKNKALNSYIHITAKRNDRFIEIAVADNGLGIPEEIQQKIFDAFFTTKPIGEGTGLGLSISNSIVSDNGGELFLDQTSATTRFVMRFPI